MSPARATMAPRLASSAAVCCSVLWSPRLLEKRVMSTESCKPTKHHCVAVWSQRVAVCCSVLHCVVVSQAFGKGQIISTELMYLIRVYKTPACCSVLQCVAMCFNVLQCAAVCFGLRGFWEGRVIPTELMYFIQIDKTPVCCSLLQCVALYCSVLCSVL